MFRTARHGWPRTPGLLARSCLVLAFGLAFAAASPAWADESDDLIRRALEMRRAGDDQGAQPLFRRAYDASRSPRSAAQLGFCEQALGRWADAEVHLGESLRVPDDPWVGKNRPAIEQALMLIKSRIARIEIAGEPAGAEVAVNGNVVGRLPLDSPVRVAGGDIEIELRAPGYAPATKRLHVGGGQYQRTTLRAEKEAVAAVTPAVAASPSPLPAAAEPSVVAPAPPAVAASGRGDTNDGGSPGAGPVRRSLKFITWGLAVGAGAYGVYGYNDKRERVIEFNDGCGITPMGTAAAKPNAPPGFDDQKCRSLKNRYEWSSTAGLIGVVSAGVLTVGGVILWLTESEPTPARTALGDCLRTLTVGQSTVGCTVRF